MKSNAVWGCSLLALVVGTGCAAKPLGTEPTMDEVKLAVAELQKINGASCDHALAASMFDAKVFTIRAFEGNEAFGSPQVVKEIESVGLLSKVFCGTEQLKLLRLQTVGGKPKALFRRWGGTGVGYYRFDFLKTQGKVRVIDWVDFAQGDSASGSMRAMMAANTGDLANAKANGEAIAQIGELMRSGKRAEAITALDALSPQQQAAKPIRLLRVSASASLPPAEYTVVLDKFAKDFGNDPAMGMILLDQHFLANRYDEVFAIVAKLRVLIGEDSALNLFEANTLLKRKGPGDVAKAETLLLAGLKLDPDAENLLSVMMDVRVAQGNAAVAAEAIRAFHKATQKTLSRSAMSTVPADMMASAAFAELDREGVLVP